VTFTGVRAGGLPVEIKQLYGKQTGDALLRIVD